MAPKKPVIALADTPANLDLLSRILTNAGYTPLCCRNEQETRERVAATHPALLIVDPLLEPRDGGVRLVLQLRENARTRRLPVLICSSDQAFLRAQAERLRGLGCTVLAKPFDLESFLTTVAALLRHRAARAADAL